MQFVDDLDREEELELESFQVGKDKLTIITIQPDPAKLEKDIAIPHLRPILTRKKTLSEEIASLDVQSLSVNALPKKQGDIAEQTFRYEGYDLITLEKLIEREYIPEIQTSQEVIGYYSKRIAQEVKLPSQFAALSPR